MSQAPSMGELKTLHESIFGRVKENLREGFPSCDLPMGVLPAWRVPHAIKYLYGRGIPMRDIQRFDLKYAAYGPYVGRVLFPLRWNGQLVGFQARAIRDLKPKYVFPKGIPASKIVYPQENLIIGWCVITEGVIPAILYQGLATFGKRLSEEQLHILMRSSKIQQIVLAWDRDAWYSDSPTRDAPALETWERLSRIRPTAGLILPEDMPQPDDLSHSAFMSATESVWKRGKQTSGIYHVDARGATERVG
jgi:hypothetical protein